MSARRTIASSGTVPGFVDTPEHREDVIVYALNRLPPRYVVTEGGRRSPRRSMEEAQQRTAIDVQVLEAMRQVTRKPRRAIGRAPREG